MLTEKQISSYHANGFLVLNEFFPMQSLLSLKQAAGKIVANFQAGENQSIFTTNDHGKTRDTYFLNSGDKICCFLEEHAFNQAGQLKQEKSISINKIGHALHRLDPQFRSFSQQALIKSIARNIGLERPEIRQSMYIYKQPRIGGVVNWHQDAAYFYTTPQTVTTFWIAIEDADENNGCLRVQPGGHKSPLREQFIREKDGTTYLKPLSDKPWPDDEDSILVPARAGTLIIFNGLLPHYSAPNLSSRSRHAFTLHITSKESEYAEENWLQAEPLQL